MSMEKRDWRWRPRKIPPENRANKLTLQFRCTSEVLHKWNRLKVRGEFETHSDFAAYMLSMYEGSLNIPSGSMARSEPSVLQVVVVEIISSVVIVMAIVLPQH